MSEFLAENKLESFMDFTENRFRGYCDRVLSGGYSLRDW